VDKEEKRQLNRALTFLAVAVVYAVFVVSIIMLLPKDSFAVLETFRVCNATIYVNGSTVPVRLYYAWNVLLMKEGYKEKSSYDFNNVGAVGMLFILNYSSVGITMKDVRLPLVAVLYIANESVVAADTFPKLISIDSVYLEPGREYALLRPVYAFVEYSPEFYYRHLNGAMHVLEIGECR